MGENEAEVELGKLAVDSCYHDNQGMSRSDLTQVCVSMRTDCLFYPPEIN
jgi:hypothetical protein